MFKKILISSDLSDASSALLTCATDWKSIGVEKAILTHVLYSPHPGGMNATFVKETKTMDKQNHDIAKKVMPILEKQKAILEEAGIEVDIEVVYGFPARAINDLAEKHEVSAIVTGSHGKGILKRATIGSVSSELIHLTRKPVFLVRSKLDKACEGVVPCRDLFNHVLYLTDFSEVAQKSLDYLEQIVKQSKCRVDILHIVSSVKESEKVLADLETIRDRLLAAGAEMADFECKEGKPENVAINHINEKNEFTLVVMGTQGKSFTEELLVGSLSLHLSRYSPIPVLLVQ